MFNDFNINNSYTGAMAPLQNNAINSQNNSNFLSTNELSNNPFNGISGIDGIKLALGSIQSLGSLWNSFQQNKLAKKALALQEKTFSTNLRNQTKTYNTALEDRIRSRYNTEGRTINEADNYISSHKL